MKSIIIIMVFVAQYALADGFQGTWQVAGCKVNGISGCAGEEGASRSFTRLASNVPMTSRFSYTERFSPGAENGLIFSSHVNNTSFQNSYTTLNVDPSLTGFTWYSFYQGIGSNPHFQFEEQWTLQMLDSTHALYIGRTKADCEECTQSISSVKELELYR